MKKLYILIFVAIAAMTASTNAWAAKKPKAPSTEASATKHTFVVNFAEIKAHGGGALINLSDQDVKMFEGSMAKELRLDWFVIANLDKGTITVCARKEATELKQIVEQAAQDVLNYKLKMLGMEIVPNRQGPMLLAVEKD
jgi:hypothetical protein